MVKRQRVVMMAGGGLALAVALYAWLQGKPATATAAAGPRAGAAARAGAATADLPRIGLDRIDQRAGRSLVGKRDIFDFGRPPAPPSRRRRQPPRRHPW